MLTPRMSTEGCWGDLRGSTPLRPFAASGHCDRPFDRPQNQLTDLEDAFPSANCGPLLMAHRTSASEMTFSDGFHGPIATNASAFGTSVPWHKCYAQQCRNTRERQPRCCTSSRRAPGATTSGVQSVEVMASVIASGRRSLRRAWRQRGPGGSCRTSSS
jgi:hypothetical protein